MDPDFLRAWQTLAGLGTPFAAGANPAAPGGDTADGFAPFAESARRFAAAAQAFLAGGATAQPAAAAGAFGDFLRDQFAGLFKPPWPWPAAAEPPSGRASAEAPVLGLGREHVLRAERAARAWARLVEAHGRLQRLWFDALRDAAAAFTAGLPPPGQEPPDAQTIDRLYDTWIECAEEAYARIAHGPAFCDALADYVNASSEWREESGATAEAWARLFDLPTRREINTLTERLRALEEEVRMLRAAPAPKAAPRPRAKAREQPANADGKPRRADGKPRRADGKPRRAHERARGAGKKSKP